MSPIAPGTLLDALSWRYATKVFDPARTIPADLWAALEQTLVLTPSSFDESGLVALLATLANFCPKQLQ